jgi:hypothetical protein
MTAELSHLFRRVIDFFLRRRTIAGVLVTAGVTLLGFAYGGVPDGEVVYQDPQRFLGLTFRSSDILPAWLTIPVFCLGVMLVFGGLYIGVSDYRHTRRLESRRKSIIVELRGLHSSPDTPADASELALPRGAVDRQVVDFRPRREGELVDPALALEKLAGMKRAVESACGGRAPEDVTLAVGGIAAVPCLFLAGMLFDNETSVTVFDWDRKLKKWRLTDGHDDGKRFLPFDATAVVTGTLEVVLAVSLSYSVDEAALQRRFGGSIPIVHLRAEEALADRYWSTEKQRACVVAFTDAVQRLMDVGVQRIHLVLVAPASLAIRLGMAYDRRLMPELIVLQYERTSPQGYPWGLRMPTHGHLEPAVEWCPVAQGAVAAAQ